MVLLLQIAHVHLCPFILTLLILKYKLSGFHLIQEPNVQYTPVE